MADLGGATLTQRDGYDVETVWPIFNFVDCDKISGGLGHPFHFRLVNYVFGWREFLVCPCLDLDKYNRAVAIDHNKVNFPHLAGVVARKGFKAFFTEEFLTPPLAPFAEGLSVF